MMFGKPTRKPQSKAKWDEWNERFEFDNGNMITMKAIENIYFYHEDFGNEVSVKQFLRTLVLNIWEQENDFNPKRPFGSSDWKSELMNYFIEKGIVEEGDFTTFDYIMTNYIKKAL